MLRWTCPGCRPSQYMVERWPTGYDVCVCSTSFGLAVVPDVKYSRAGREVQQQRLVWPGLDFGLEIAKEQQRVVVTQPARHRVIHRNPRPVTLHVGELLRVSRRADDMPYVSPL